MNIDIPKLLKFLKSRGFITDGGYGPLKGKTMRIGHMGNHRLEDLEQLLLTFDDFLRESGKLKQ